MMRGVQSVWILLALVYCSIANKPKKCMETCVLTNEACMTKGSDSVLKSVVTGSNGLVEPMDPLNIDKIDDPNGPNKSTLTQVRLRGMKNCTVTKLGIDVNATVYTQHVYCPLLMSSFTYKTNAASCVGGPVERRYNITADEYKILNKGMYSIVILRKDHMPHADVQSVEPKVNLQGDLKYDVNLQCDRKAKKCEECKNTNQKNMAEYLNSLIVKRAMTLLLLDRMQSYCQKFHLSEVFPQSNDPSKPPTCECQTHGSETCNGNTHNEHKSAYKGEETLETEAATQTLNKGDETQDNEVETALSEDVTLDKEDTSSHIGEETPDVREETPDNEYQAPHKGEETPDKEDGRSHKGGETLNKPS